MCSHDYRSDGRSYCYCIKCGKEYGEMAKYHSKKCTKKEAIKYLNKCRIIHWRYTKHPSWCRGWLGSQQHHKEWVDRYTEIINLLKYDSKINRSK